VKENRPNMKLMMKRIIKKITVDSSGGKVLCQQDITFESCSSVTYLLLISCFSAEEDRNY
jgi:hypothetical protein